MSYGIKRLADVELLNTTPEYANKLVEVDGEVKRVPNKDNGLPEGGAPHQQLVTGADGAAKWEDKLCYTIPPERVEIVAPVTVTIEPDGGAYAGGQLNLEKNSPLFTFISDAEDGKAYVVVFDGVEYVCKAYEDDGTCVGNGELYGSSGGNGEPFLLNNGYGHTLRTTEAGEHTIAIYEPGEETFKTIDPKYLPEGVGYMLPPMDIVAIPEMTFDVQDVYADNVNDLVTTVEYKNFDESKLYRVVWDGVEYRDLPVYTIGSNPKSTIGFHFGDYPVPFEIMNEYGYIYVGCASAENKGVHTFSVYEQGEPEPVPIPEEFIPPLSALVLRSPSGKLFKLSVSDDGEPAFAEVTD